MSASLHGVREKTGLNFRLRHRTPHPGWEIKRRWCDAPGGMYTPKVTSTPRCSEGAYEISDYLPMDVVMSLPYHKVDWDLVREVRQLQGRVRSLEKQLAELHRLVSASLATKETS